MSEASSTTANGGGDRLRRVWSRLVRLTDQVMGDPPRPSVHHYPLRAHEQAPVTRDMTLAEVEEALSSIHEDDMRRARASLADQPGHRAL